jgi:3-hydroxyisobutyrate dehydrogenase
MNLPLPGLALIHQLYVSLQANGGGRHGTQALMLVLEQMCDTTVAAKREGL